MDLGLEGRIAIVTGASSGIGLAIAGRLLGEGVRVALCGRDEARLAAAHEALGKPSDVQTIAADVSRPEQVAKLVEATLSAFGGLDIVVSNAGTHLRGSFEELSASQVESHFRTKVLGPWELARHSAAHLRQSTQGRFIVIIGQAGKVPGRNVLASAAVNAAQHGFVKSLADDLGRDGVLVNAVCPSRITSPLTHGLTIDDEVYLGRSLEQHRSRWGENVPLGRWGDADDIADAVAFLASARAGFMCGANVDVDGGHQRMIF